MSWSTVRTIYAKELRDLLRDRRTVLSSIVIPTVIMPVLILGFGKVATTIISKAKQEIPRIMVVGGADSPGVRAELVNSGKFKVESASPDWKTLISEKRVRAAVEIPDGFEKARESGSAPPITIYMYDGELKSGIAVDQLDGFFTRMRERTVTHLLADRGLPATMAKPFEVKEVNVASPEKRGGNLFGGIVPYFLIFLCLSGAMYPAMDITAGEKERGTMETLLCSPAARTDIVLGKFLTVLTGSLSAVVFSLISMGATLLFLILTASPKMAGSAMQIPTIDPVGILGVLAMVLPVSVLFSAILFTVSLFAKSFKEAQTYITPMIFIVIIPVVMGMLPGVELNSRLAMVPLLNISLVSKEMLSGVWHWGYIGMIFGSTALYAAVALSLAVRMFKREDVIFRA
jgi:sodium transport system permease protein